MATILIVDDRPINRKFLLTLLGYSNHRLIEACDGAEALKIIRAECPDLVITDIVMPTMDGFELVQQMRNEPEIAGTQVIFYTATYRLQESKELAEACGVSIVIPKPSDPETILLKVNSALLHIEPPSPTAPQASAAESVPEIPVLNENLNAYLEDLRSANERMSSVIERGMTIADQEARLAEVSEKLRQTLGSLQGSNLKLATIIELGLELASQRDPGRLPTIFCHAAQDVIGARYAVLGILAHDGESLSHFVTHGSDPEELTQLTSPSPHAGILGALIKESRPRRLRDLDGDPQKLGLPASHPPVYSFLGLPIASSLQVYGWLYLVDRLDADEFSEADEQIAMTLAAQFAIAYESANLYDEVQRHAVKLQLESARRKKAEEEAKRNLERIRALHEIDLAITSTLDLRAILYVLLENVDRFLLYPSASEIRLLNKETGLLEPVAARNVSLEEWKTETLTSGMNFVKEIMQKGSPLTITDLQTDPRTRQMSFFRKHGLVSYLGAPLIDKEEFLGVLSYFTKDKHQFSDEEIEFLNTLAGQAAIAIHNSQLYEQTKKQSGDLSVANENLQKRERIQALLKEINQDSMTLDLIINSLLQKLTDRVREFICVDIADVRIMEPDGSYPIAASGAALKELEGRRAGASDRRTWLMETRRPLVIPDTATTQVNPTSSIARLKIRSYLGAPLFSRAGELMGVLRALTYQPRDFSQEEIDLIEQLAHGAASAMENSRLYEDLKTTNTKLREREEIQRLLKELSQDITTMDLVSLLQKLTDKVRDFLNADICDIGIRESDATRVMAASGISLEKLRSLPGRGQSRLGTYSDTREPIRVSDLSRDQDRVTEGSTALTLGVRGYLGAPFFAKDGAFLGIIRALTYEPRDFSPQEADLLQQLANGAAIAVENARLYRDLEKSNKVKSEFLGVMSHELRTPINIIMGYTGIMQDKVLGDVSAKQQDALAKVARQTDELLTMVTGIMEATKIESGSTVLEKYPVDLVGLLDELKRTCEIPFDKAELALIWDYPSDLPNIITDGGKLKMIIQNLISNAIKFTDNGSITVSARIVENKGQSAKDEEHGAKSREQSADSTAQGAISPMPSALSVLRFVEFRVTDTGIGIAEENLPTIFDMFRQVDSSDTRLYGGVGLGLYIVKKFTELLGGTVEVESQVGKGSSFTVTLPCGERKQLVPYGRRETDNVPSDRQQK